ncbi:Pimeloyl-ACP methyl ester carboxylesterase [Mucilaginibacter gossypiicola]|uniref:Pimeloyl-ACP methyl ester carboxylesterase n=1 Tax=Mucilaginibacter gossypiicola TaxID=551995 RepID=A0A1H8NV25_9SPHI|nr:epoxide hydrolase family protein [Mucilaginibacter gossypiicola]SEO33198.1 Pimeloyl-ACP methyl ester carboxylesterase [Mucilaginibacter gossypiicola]
MRNLKTTLLSAFFSAAVGLCTLQSKAQTQPTVNKNDKSIRPFHVHVTDEQLADLKKRLLATRWPGRETANDESQGLRKQQLQNLVKYWASGYDWRKGEAKLNALPMFVTNIDGLDIQFIHVRSKHPKALPLIMTHGWPGSIFELLKVIDPLTNPTAYGGKAEDAFDVVIPSLPGFGFSGQPANTGWGSDHIARAWGELMNRLGYKQFVSQGGDCGSVISQRMALQHVPGLLAIHINMPATVPPDIAAHLTNGDDAPAGLSVKEKAAYESLNNFYKNNCGYAAMMVTRPQTVGYALADSPVGQAAWMYDKIVQWTYSGGEPEKVLSRDEILDDISLYWLTNSATSAAQIYWEDHSNNFNAREISTPVAVTVFPGEIYQAPKTWAERCYHNLIYFNEVNNGGHFAAWEQPQLLAEEIRAAFKSVR